SFYQRSPSALFWQASRRLRREFGLQVMFLPRMTFFFFALINLCRATLLATSCFLVPQEIQRRRSFRFLCAQRKRNLDCVFMAFCNPLPVRFPATPRSCRVFNLSFGSCTCRKIQMSYLPIKKSQSRRRSLLDFRSRNLK